MAAPPIDKTPGGTYSNSYADLIDLQNYADRRPHAPDLTDYTSDQQTEALLEATRQFDQRDPRGTKTFASGSLRFPRTALYDRDGYSLSHSEIPKDLRDATCEAALSFLVEDRMTESDMAGYKRVKIGSLEFEADVATETGVLSAISLQLADYLFRNSFPNSVRTLRG